MFFKIVPESCPPPPPSFLESVLSCNWDKSQFDFIPEVEIEHNRQSAKWTISSDNEELEYLFVDDNLFPDKI